ncbi:MAG TPA: T9SS type A sorting domain-containing protein, partial [Chitinophagaceae bacterium]|nr:T9SS type A sorting domain-containing protein [Chitinophagaceae bacterium]
VTGIGGPPPNTRDFIRYISADASQLLIVTGGLNTRTMNVQLFDMAGKMIYDSQKSYGQTSIPVSGLPRGIYQLRVIGNNNEQYHRKFIK